MRAVDVVQPVWASQAGQLTRDALRLQAARVVSRRVPDHVQVLLAGLQLVGAQVVPETTPSQLWVAERLGGRHYAVTRARTLPTSQAFSLEGRRRG